MYQELLLPWGGNDPGIGIPAVMVSQIDGEAIISALLASTPINGTLQSSGNLVQLDGDFDNGIIAHEYGHGYIHLCRWFSKWM